MEFWGNGKWWHAKRGDFWSISITNRNSTTLKVGVGVVTLSGYLLSLTVMATGATQVAEQTNGGVIVVDWLEGREENGMFNESRRRRVDVMVKNHSRFPKTSGWGFERFNGDSRTERIVTSAATQCFACYSGQAAPADDTGICL
jgi:hypothetical protein